jgi:hypothetical protein
MRKSILLALIVAFAAGACGSSGQTAAPPAGSTSSSPSALDPAADAPTAGLSAEPAQSDPAASPPAATVEPTATASPAPDDTVWLCKPGLSKNPCEGSLDATVVDATGKSTVQPASSAADPPIDCFYVYPTVSLQKGANASLSIDPEERAVALAQAARFSQVCRVYAPIYPQLTLAAIATPSKISYLSALVAYNYVDSAFRNYMAHYNHGRGIVFIGHSQGALMLTALLRAEVDSNPDTRRLLVSALLLGGNVTVPVGKSVGGDFANIPACSTAAQIGCVVAYSSFASTPPTDALFGRAGSGINPFAGSSTVPLAVLCVNPAAPGGGSAALRPYFPTQGLRLFLGSAAPAPVASTPFVSYPGEFSAECKSSGGANWLQIDRVGGASDQRPALNVAEAPTWGLHVVDVNIALGNLVDLVRSESAAFH